MPFKSINQGVPKRYPQWGNAGVGAGVNLLKWSEDFSNAPWTKVGKTVTPNATLTPAKGPASLIVPNGGGNHWLYQAVSFVAGTYTFSYHFKRPLVNAWPFMNLKISNGISNSHNVFDVSAQAFVTTGSNVTGTAIERLADWFRLSVTFTSITANGNVACDLALDSTGNPAYDATGNNLGAYITGVQLNAGLLLPYQKTTSVALS